MRRLGAVIVLAGMSISITANLANAEVVRPGDRLRLRLVSALNAASAHSGDTLAVTIPDGLQADPNGSPEIPPGTVGTATFKLVEKTPTLIKYDIISLSFAAKAGRIEIKTALAADEPTAVGLTVQKANAMKKLLIPPLLGFLIWKDKAGLTTGKEIRIEISEQKRW